MSFNIGTRVEGKGGVNKGVVAFCGPTQFAEGVWVGIILDEPNGKNDGSVKGVQYFECEENHGIFMKPVQVFLEGQGGGTTGEPIKSKMPVPSSGIKPPATIRKDTSGSKSKLDSTSPGPSPKMSPAQSMELRPSGIVPPKKASPKDDAKTSTTQARTSIPGSQSRIGPNEPAVVEARRASNAETNPDAVRSLIRKLEEVPSAAPALPLDRRDATELELLRLENKDLSEKLESLRAKRKEDHAKLVDLERTRIQLQQLQEYKSKITAEHSDLHRQLAEARKEAKEAIEARHAHQEEMSGVAEQMEMAALDREMAEEKAELAQQELEASRERIQELELDLELLKNEMEQAGQGGTAPMGNSVQMKQLEKQNERLRGALVKMRDVTGQANIERSRVLKENEELKAEVAEMQRRNEKMKETVAEAEAQLIEYKEQVDAALGSEEMIETLTARNLEMEERIKATEETIEDLEAMRQMDEEILETERDTTRDLRQELDLSNGRINELYVKIRSYVQQADDYDKTIMKFRQRVSDLQEDIQDHKDQILRLEDRLNQRERSVGDEDGPTKTVAFAASRNFADMIESETRRIELTSCKEHAMYLKAFLPDNFAKPGGDHDALMVNLYFPRLAEKSALLMKLLEEKYPQVPGGIRREHVLRSHKAEQWAYAAKFTYHLQALGGVLHKFESAIARCSTDRLARLAQMYTDMPMHERAVDQYMELLKTNRLDENTALDSLNKAFNYFQNIYSVHMAGDAFDVNRSIVDVIQQQLAGLRWLRVNCQRIVFFLQAEGQKSELAKFAEEMQSMIGECEQYAMRAKNRVSTEKELVLTAEVSEQVSSTNSALEKVENVLQNMCTVASNQVSMSPDMDGLEAQRLKEMLHGAVEKVYGNIDIDKTMDQVRNYANTLRTGLLRFSELLDLGTLEVEKDGKKAFPALLERAHARKQDAVEAEGLRWQIEKKDNEIVEMKKQLRAAKDDVSNIKVRLEMADMKMKTPGKDDARSQRLQTQCDELRMEMEKTKRECERTMDAIQKELEESQKENKELKDRAKQISKKALLANLSQGVAMSPGSPSVGGPSEYYDYLINDLQSQLRWANSQIRSLRAREMREDMENLAPLTVTQTIVAGPGSLLNAAQSQKNDEIERLVKEFYDFKAEHRRLTLPHVSAKAQRPEQREAEEAKRLAQLQRLNHWFNDLRVHTMRCQAIQRFGSAAATDSGLVYPSAELARSMVSAKEQNPAVKKPFTAKPPAGIHSQEYKAMRAKLVKYGEESKAFLAAHGSTVSASA